MSDKGGRQQVKPGTQKGRRQKGLTKKKPRELVMVQASNAEKTAPRRWKLYSQRNLGVKPKLGRVMARKRGHINQKGNAGAKVPNDRSRGEIDRYKRGGRADRKGYR